MSVLTQACNAIYREGKQLSKWEKYQCHKARIQRNHIGCRLIVWVRLKEIAIAFRASAELMANNSNV